jgi:DNA-binding NarL/FixJ family response regulator
MTTTTTRWEEAKSKFRAAREAYEKAIQERDAARKELLAELQTTPQGVTKRELEVLEMVRDGKANKEIAIKLNLAERTVKFHVSSLLAKFGVTTRHNLRGEIE